MMKARDRAALQAAIDERDFTHRELAAVAECSRNTPYRLLNGGATGDETATRLARALRRDVGDLFVDAVSTDEPTVVDQQAAS